ncbi:MAG TPA: hypothetical protein PKA81_02080 [Clostridia bacterium]|nr:hypothetical protein [Clostridia bacterium]
MKRKHMIFMYLAIFLITEAVFFLNMLKPSFQVILASLVGAALVSLVIGTMILAVFYLVRKLNGSKA